MKFIEVYDSKLPNEISNFNPTWKTFTFFIHVICE